MASLVPVRKRAEAVCRAPAHLTRRIDLSTLRRPPENLSGSALSIRMSWCQARSPLQSGAGLLFLRPKKFRLPAPLPPRPPVAPAWSGPGRESTSPALLPLTASVRHNLQSTYRADIPDRSSRSALLFPTQTMVAIPPLASLLE